MIARGVLAPASAPAACVVALVLLAAFTAAIGHQLRRGRHPHCSCFGATIAPISGWTVARNAAIGVLVMAALVGSLVHEGLPSGLPADHAIAIAAIVALAAVQVRQGAALRVRGTPAAILIDARGRIASPVAAGPAAIRELIAGQSTTTTSTN